MQNYNTSHLRLASKYDTRFDGGEANSRFRPIHDKARNYGRRSNSRVAKLNDECDFRHLKRRRRRKIVGSCTFHASSLVLHGQASNTRAFVASVSGSKKACRIVRPLIRTILRHKTSTIRVSHHIIPISAYRFRVNKKMSRRFIVIRAPSLFDTLFLIVTLAE